MVELTGSDTYFTNIDSDFTATQWESCIDQAIDKINGYARDDILPNMGGTAGSKSVSVESKAAGFIRELAAAIYAKNVKTAGAASESFGMGSLSHSQSTGGAGSADVETLAKDAAMALREIEVSYG